MLSANRESQGSFRKPLLHDRLSKIVQMLTWTWSEVTDHVRVVVEAGIGAGPAVTTDMSGHATAAGPSAGSTKETGHP